MIAAVAAPASAVAAPASASPCPQRVIADWRDRGLDGTYGPGCLRQALVSLPEDLRIYGSAEEDITRALNGALESTSTSSPMRSLSARGSSTRARSAEAAAAPKLATKDQAAFSVRVAIAAAGLGLVVLGVAAAVWRTSRRRTS